METGYRAAHHSVGFTAVGQTFGAAPVVSGHGAQFIPGTHTFLAPESIPVPPVQEVPGDYVSLDEAYGIDQPGFHSIGSSIISFLFVSLVISLVCCFARADFNFPILVYGYYVWCVRSNYCPEKLLGVVGSYSYVPKMANGKAMPKYLKEYADEKERQALIPVKMAYERTTRLRFADAPTIESVRYFTYLLLITVIVDLIWIPLTFSTWTCKMDAIFLRTDDPRREDRYFCFNTHKHRPLINTYYPHLFVLYLSIANAVLRLTMSGLSFLWIRQQTRAWKNAALVEEVALPPTTAKKVESSAYNPLLAGDTERKAAFLVG